MPKLPSFNNVYIPKDIEFMDDSGEMIKNADFPDSEQVKCNLRYATIDEKNTYMQSYGEKVKNKKGEIKIKTDYSYRIALEKHVLKVENLLDNEGKALVNGKDLGKNNNPALNELKEDLFYRICGIRLNEDDTNDGPSELSEKEKQA